MKLNKNLNKILILSVVVIFIIIVFIYLFNKKNIENFVECPYGEGILKNSKCGSCPYGEGILPDGKCGSCPDGQGIGYYRLDDNRKKNLNYKKCINCPSGHGIANNGSKYCWLCNKDQDPQKIKCNQRSPSL